MKSYEIRIGSPESESVVTFNDRRYNRLSDAAKALDGILTLMKNEPEIVDDDLCFWVVRKNSAKKKGAKQEESNIVQVVAGNDEDSKDFCYEGIYFLSNCSDFERMILVGEKQNAWIGDYGVRIESGKQSELCFYSDLEMILDSIKDLKENKEQIRNRLMTLIRHTPEGAAESMAQLLYTLNPDGSLRLQYRILIDDDSADEKALQAFVAEETGKAPEAEEAETDETVTEETVTEEPAEEAAPEEVEETVAEETVSE